jgi:signal transduction histidine kinase
MGYAQLVEGRLAKLDVNEMLETALSQVFPKGSKFGIRIRRDYGIALPPLLAQPEHISEVFVNIIQNAREVMGNDGEIRVKTSYEGDYTFRVTIEDNGPGIPADRFETVFEPYHTTKAKGTGLGLAIVKHNTELYGGTVKIESELGKHTRFTLIFPGRTALRLQAL